MFPRIYMRICTFRLTFYLAWRDLMSEKILALCIISGLVSTLLPMLLLAGLKAGLIDHMRQNLLHDPRAREISSARNYPYPAQLLKNLRTSKNVVFLLPKTRSLAASVRLQTTGTTSIFEGTDAELVPTMSGDPLLEHKIPASFSQSLSQTIPAIISSHLAEHMHLQPGNNLTMLIGRHGTNAEKTARIHVNVINIADDAATSRFQIFVPLPIAQAAEEWRENVKLTLWKDAITIGERKSNSFLSTHTENETWPGFRLYTNSLSDVIVLDKALTQQGLSISSELPRVETILNIDRQTTRLFHLIAYVGTIGFTVTLATAIAAETERKKLHLATLTFLGVRNSATIPVMQALLLAISSACSAFCIAWFLSWPANEILRASLLQSNSTTPVIIITFPFALQLLSYIIPGTFIMAWATTYSLRRVSAWQGICST